MRDLHAYNVPGLTAWLLAPKRHALNISLRWVSGDPGLLFCFYLQVVCHPSPCHPLHSIV